MKFEEKTVTIKGQKFRFRELSVAENDECADAARNPDGTVNGRTMMRMMIIKASLDPKLDTDMIGNLPQRAYIKIYDAVSDLNTIDLSDEDEDGGNA
jgi:hypothetical protein